MDVKVFFVNYGLKLCSLQCIIYVFKLCHVMALNIGLVLGALTVRKAQLVFTVIVENVILF